MSDTKKLLRFGCDNPRCVKCGSADRRRLCQVRLREGSGLVIVCRNCRAQGKQPSRTAMARKAERFRSAGYFEPACVICNEPTLQILEVEHLAGVANSDLVEPLCANHHAIKSYIAETGPMAALRRPDPSRSALGFEAAFDFGLAAIFGIMAAADSGERVARAVFLGLVAAALVGWGVWNLSADEHFERVLGPGYDRGIPAPVPR